MAVHMHTTTVTVAKTQIYVYLGAVGWKALDNVGWSDLELIHESIWKVTTIIMQTLSRKSLPKQSIQTKPYKTPYKYSWSIS